MEIKKQLEKEMGKHVRHLRNLLARHQQEPEKAAKKAEPARDDVFGLNDQEVLKNAGFDLEAIRKISATPKSPATKPTISPSEELLLRLIEKYEGWTVVTKEILKKVCCDSELCCAQIKHYAGHVDDGISKTIEQFCKEHAYSTKPAQFFIVTSRDMFAKDPNKVIAANEKRVNTALFIQAREDENKDTFILIRQWGEHIGILQRLQGLACRGPFTGWLIWTFIPIVAFAAVLGMVGAMLSWCCPSWDTLKWLFIILSGLWTLLTIWNYGSEEGKCDIRNYRASWYKP